MKKKKEQEKKQKKKRRRKNVPVFSVFLFLFRRFFIVAGRAKGRDSSERPERGLPFLPRAGCRYPCQLCGTPLRARSNITFCRPDGRTESKQLQWALDNGNPPLGLYNAARSDVLIVCTRCHNYPEPWGSAPGLRDVSHTG